MKVFVVRHAHAGSRKDWAGPDLERPLSERGRQQAEGIADQLVEARPTRLLSSPATRCVQTLQPLGARLGVPVEVEPRLLEGTSGRAVRELLDELDGTAALCSHGDVIPDLLESLAAEGTRFKDDLRWPKASTWALSSNGSRLAKASYVPPPAR